MQVIGNIGSVPEQKHGGKSGKPFTRFSFCENHTRRDYEGPTIAPTWYDVTAFPTPETEVLLQRGAFLKLTGRLEPQVWFREDDKQTRANPQISLKFVVNKIEAMPRRDAAAGEQGSSAQAPAAAPQQAPRPAPTRQAPAPAAPVARQPGGFDDMDDDIPF